MHNSTQLSLHLFSNELTYVSGSEADMQQKGKDGKKFNKAKLYTFNCSKQHSHQLNTTHLVFKFNAFLAQCIVHYNSTTLCTSNWPCSICSVQDSISWSYILISSLQCFKASGNVVHNGVHCSSASFFQPQLPGLGRDELATCQYLSPNIACLE